MLGLPISYNINYECVVVPGISIAKHIPSIEL